MFELFTFVLDVALACALYFTANVLFWTVFNRRMRVQFRFEVRQKVLREVDAE